MNIPKKDLWAAQAAKMRPEQYNLKYAIQTSSNLLGLLKKLRGVDQEDMPLLT